ncbi:MAG: helix-turn-helix transcriptional regulator [bacterium]|nr:helix-turn-helix transcriptional regulator [bacterium]
MKRKEGITAGKNLCGARIREAREAKAKKEGRKFTIVSLMAALAVDHGIEMDTRVLARIERQERQINDKELLAISEVLEVSLDWLLKGD